MARLGKGAAIGIGLVAAGAATAYFVARPVDGAKTPSAKEAARAMAREKLVKLPLSFEANRGQVDPAVKFVARGAGATMWLTDEEAVLGFSTRDKGTTDVLRMSFVGARTSPATGAAPQQAKSNYLRGEGGNVLGAPHFGEVVEKDLYPGVDLRWHGEKGALEYDLLVAAGAAPSAIRLKMRGADSLAVRENGDLAVRVGEREIVQAAPVAWQERNGTREPVAAAFEVRGDEVSFRLGARDASLPLVIDPSISFSTYIGGSGDETANGVAVDPVSGDFFVCGGTTSIDFPAGFGHIPTSPKGSSDAYIVRINAPGTFVEWSTYLAGTDYDEAFDCVYDPVQADVFIVGQTFSSNFPVFNPTQASRAGKWDGFLTEIDGTGDHLLFSTYFGGTGDDFPRALALGSDPTDPNLYITGFTESSTSFPLAGAVQPTYGGGAYDAFVMTWKRFTPSGGFFKSTFLGGPGDDRGLDVQALTGIPAAGQPGTVDVVNDGSFETGGFGNWIKTDFSSPYYPLQVRSGGDPQPDPIFFATTPTQGTKAAVTGFEGAAGSASLSQDVIIPPTSDLGAVTFDWRAQWCSADATRTFKVQLLPSGGGAVQQTSTVFTMSASSETVVNFDDLTFPPHSTGDFLAPLYGNILWGVDWALDNPGNANPIYPSHSNPIAIYPTGVVPGERTFYFPLAPVCFEGAWISGLGTVQWNLYYHGSLVGSSGSHPLSNASTFIASGYTGLVDEVRLDTALPGFVRVDDVSYRTISNSGPNSSNVPFDLTPFAGSGCRLRFLWTIPTSNTGFAKFQLDNIHFYAAKGAVVVAGRTASPTFPHANVFRPDGFTVQNTYGGGLADAFVTEFKRNISAVNWSTTYGGKGEDEAHGVAIAPNGDVSFTGNTNSFDFPRVLALQPTRKGPDDAFLVKILNGAYVLDVSTYFGGHGSDSGNAIRVNPSTGDLYVLGTTDSLDLPVTADALQPTLAGLQNQDAFVARFGTVTNTFGIPQPGFIKYASYFGGTAYEKGKRFVLPSGSTMVIVGDTNSSSGLPLFGALFGTLNGPSDGYLAKLDVSSILFPARELIADPRSPDTVALSWSVSEPTEATAYKIERTTPGGVTTDVATVPVGQTSYVDSGLTPDTAYAYSVSAIDKDGVKDAANVVQTSTPPYAPAAPTGLTVAADGAKVVLDWTDASTNETGFDIQRSTGGELKTIATVKANVTHFEATQILAGATQSNWRVVAVNRGGSAFSEVVSAQIAPTLTVQTLSGSLVDSDKAGADRFVAAGRLSGVAAFDPNTQALRVEAGDAADPLVLSIPAGDRGWRVKRGSYSWASSRSFVGGARFTLDLDAKKGTFSLSVTNFDFPAAPANPVSIGFALGSQAGASHSDWTAKGVGKLSLK